MCGRRGAGYANAPAGSRHAHEVALGEQLGDLDGVGRGALAQVVADDPEVEAALVRGVAADPADQHLVAPGGVGGERVDAVAGRVHDDDAGRAGEQLAALLGREVASRSGR